MANGGMIQRSASTPALRSAPRHALGRDGPLVAPLAPLRRRPSAISLEKHGCFIFDEINSLLEGDDSTTSSSGSSCDHEVLVDREVRPVRGALPRTMSELSLDSFDGHHHDEGEDPTCQQPQEAPHQDREGRNVARDTPGQRLMTTLQRHHTAPVAGTSPTTTTSGRTASLLSRIEQKVIDKGVRDGKLVRTLSHVSFRGSAIRRTMSVGVIQEDRELSHEDVAQVRARMSQVWANDVDEDLMRPMSVSVEDYAHSYSDEEEDDDAIFF